MADSVEQRMSVTSIKRVDPYVKDILATATHVALYKFNTSTNEWEKTDTEGALFVYSRNGEPFHSVMVMNRLNTNNVIEPIVKDFDYQMQVPFLLYKNSKSKIFGIWFFNREECIRITYLIETLMEDLKEKTPEGGPSSKSNNNGVDIFSLLSKAQEDYNKTPTKQNTSLPPAAFSTPQDCTSKSVMDFFAKATSTKPKAGPVGGEGEHVLQRLMSNPVHTVEHIEKQQRSITPQEQLPPQPTDRRSVPISFTSGHHKNESLSALLKGASPSPPQAAASRLSFLLDAAGDQSQDTNQRTSPFAQFLMDGASSSSSDKPHQLMTPMMFTTTTATSPGGSGGGISNNKGLLHSSNNIDLLTEKQLAQALIHLLRTNSNFTRQIHEAYVSSIMEKVNLGNN